MTLAEAAQRIGVQPATLRRWVKRGLIPPYEGEWTPSAIGTARVVARMRERGHSLDQIEAATKEGRLAFGFLEDLFPSEPHRMSIRDAAEETGLDEALVARLISGLGLSPERSDSVTEDELQLLRYVAAVLGAGFPLVAL
ncbi:MAG TPA: helix-turn-helix domain-containing protein, partial [Solirubrobacteraceae bacterium]